MKSYNAFLVFVVVAVVIGQVQSRATRDVSVTTSPTENEVDPQCNYKAIPNTQFDVPFIVLNLQSDCVNPSLAFLFRLNQASSRDAYKQVFQNACAQESSIKTCIAGVAAENSGCLNKMEAKMFDTVRGYVESSVSAVCRNGSEMVARMYADELKSLSVSGQLAVVACMGSMKVQSAYNREIDQATYTMRRYRAMKEGRNCIKEAALVAGGSSTAFQAFADPLIGSMKCISPTTEEIVLCETLVYDSIDFNADRTVTLS